MSSVFIVSRVTFKIPKAQPCVQAQIKENIKAPRHWPLWGGFTGDRWIPRTKGQWQGKCFHLMTSSWYITGWRMLLHTGSTWGYGALMTLLPDADIAVYMSVNGPDDGYYGRRLTSLYILDLLLGETPWLNETSACEFPYKTASNTNLNVYVDLNDDTGDQDSSQVSESDITSIGSSYFAEDPSAYTGQYGNFAYGNISIRLENGDELHLHYGDIGHWLLQEISHDVYLGVGQDDLWSLNISQVTFKRKDNCPHQVTLTLESKDPPVFIRDLRMSDAPPPPDPEQCGTGGSGRNVSNTVAVGGVTFAAYIASVLYTAFN